MLLLLLVKEPKRGAFEAPSPDGIHDQPPSLIGAVREFFSRPSLLFAALGCGFCAFIGYASLNWTPAFLTRAKGINMGEIALYYSLMIAVSAGLGTFLSGWMVDWLGKRSKIWYALIPMLAMTVSIPFHAAFIMAPTWQTSLALLSVPTFLNIFYLAPALAVVQNSVRPKMRAIAGALLLLVNNLIGLGGGPTFVGDVSTRLEPVYGSAGGLSAALMWLLPFYGVAIFFLALEALALRRESRS
jgi:MFS family permease